MENSRRDLSNSASFGGHALPVVETIGYENRCTPGATERSLFGVQPTSYPLPVSLVVMHVLWHAVRIPINSRGGVQ